MSSHPGTAATTLTDATSTDPALRGMGTLEFSHNKSGIIWRVRQMAILSQPTGLLTLETYFNGLPLMTPITVYSGACADGEPPMELGDHDKVEVRVTYGPPGANIILAYFYEEVVAA